MPLRTKLSQALDRLATVEGAGGEVHISNNLSTLLNLTDKYAQKRGDQYISSELFLLARLEDRARVRTPAQGSGRFQKWHRESHRTPMRGGQKVEDPGAEEGRQALEKYTIDLTERAEQGKLDPVIGATRKSVV